MKEIRKFNEEAMVPPVLRNYYVSQKTHSNPLAPIPISTASNNEELFSGNFEQELKKQIHSIPLLDLEIGAGSGWHSITYAKNNPTRTLISIEHSRTRFDRFKNRCCSNELDNLIALQSQAEAFVTGFLPPLSLSRIFILYPNPNLKNPAKRWLRMPFFSALLDRLKVGGEIILTTNQEWYFTEALQMATRVWNLRVLHSTCFSKAIPPVHGPRTHFEKKYLLRGDRCFEVRFGKGE